MKKLIMKFEDERAMHGFMEWLCGAGEQDYWNHVEAQSYSTVHPAPTHFVSCFDYDFEEKEIHCSCDSIEHFHEEE